ncbi:A disintegrin and metallopeptidase domain 3-like [Loxodonta africana]|uniref:A disintegrin and metallopeptidase domain 3-like n=1 Tax=Loxodonta africana TaxID=9785 RepID=UPI0030CE9444
MSLRLSCCDPLESSEGSVQGRRVKGMKHVSLVTSCSVSFWELCEVAFLYSVSQAVADCAPRWQSSKDSLSWQGNYTLSFLDPHFLVYSYNKSGALQSRSSFLKDHCFYRGYAAEVLNSVATLNTCSGLRGLLQLENVSYGIEPLQSAGTYEHMLYQIRNKKIDFFPSQGNYLMKPPEDQVNRILVKSEKNPDAILLKRNLKVQIILDKALYDYMGSDVAIAEEKVVQMFGLINTMFSQLKVTVRLSSLELWSDKNKISTNGDPNDILQRFLAWKEAYLVQRPHDMAYLLIYRDYPNYVGATYHGVACNPKLAAGIALYPKLITLEAFSVVMTQLLGINLGLTYDAIYKCYCPGSTCIMNPDSIHSHGVKFFSSCSLDEFKHVVTQPEFECLQNQIISKVAFQGRQSHSTCGNGRLEPPEECDCGSAEACEYKKCCNPLDCTLLESAECGTGPCCNPKTCQVTEHGEVCRESVDPCDLIEYCNGTSELCGPDMNTLNFEQCLNETAFCYNGLCRSMDRQCFEVFGKFARGADYLCLQEVNSHADDFGRCIGRTCTYEGILCGKIVCHWTTTDLVTMADYDVQYTYVAGRVCVSAAVTEAAFWSIFDNTFVEMGTICGSDKVCNTNHHCQCEAGYAPPNCVPAPSSQGGSIDDGFWQWGGVFIHAPTRDKPGEPRVLVDESAVSVRAQGWIGDSEEIMLHVTVPRKIRSKESEDSGIQPVSIRRQQRYALFHILF